MSEDVLFTLFVLWLFQLSFLWLSLPLNISFF